PLYISALGPKAARLAGRLGEGWITLNLPQERLEQVLSSFEEGVKMRQNDKGLGLKSSEKPLKIAEIILSYDQDLETAIEACRPFAGTLSPKVFHNDIIDPREIGAAGQKMDKKVIAEAMLATNNFERIISAVEKFHRFNFDIVEVASLSPDQKSFMKLFRENVMPQFS
ncbi:MAG: LLM class flavin-dependent oxidoreductase, partial [Nitrososphaerales archaeon]